MKEKTADEIILEHNKMITKIIQECDWMMENRHYMSDIAIRNCAERIKNIANFYVQEADWLGE